MANKTTVTDEKRMVEFGRQDGYFYIQDGLATADPARGESPMTLMAKFSRFPVYITKKGEHACMANIHPRALYAMGKYTEYAMNLHMRAINRPKQEGAADSVAYTTLIRSGNLKGRTPADILLKDQDGRTALERQAAFLENQNKTPGNKYIASNNAQIKAIREAIQLFDAGKLNSSAGQAVMPTITIYEAEYRSLESQKLPNGKVLVYSIAIKWHVGLKTPVSVEISNSYAPLIRETGGRTHPDMSQQEMERKYTYSLTDEEWGYCIDEMRSHLEAFKNSVYAGQRKRMDRIRQSRKEE